MALRLSSVFPTPILLLGLTVWISHLGPSAVQAQQAKVDPKGTTSTRLMMQGDDNNDVLASSVALRDVLAAYGGNNNPNNLGQLISEIKSSNDNSSASVPGMTGLGGGYGRVFLELAEEALRGNGQFDNGKRVVTSFSGQIQDYQYNSGDGSGRLEVMTFITSRVVPAGAGLPPPKIEAYKWKIRIDPGGFTVVPKGSDPNNPFPGTLEFSDAMKDRVNSLGFQYKLWAKGTKIVVEEVSLDRNYKPLKKPNFKVLRASDPKYTKLYQSDAASCIDMMFVEQPPAQMADLKGPPFYCLGRCDHPKIINTR